MSQSDTPLPTREDLKLAEDLIKHGPRVTIREIMRRQSIFPTSAALRRRLNTLVEAGMGTWKYTQPSSNGGRPQELFILTASTHEVEELIALLRRALNPPLMRGRCIYRDITALLNRHSRISSARLASIFKSLTQSLCSHITLDLDGLPRKYRVTQRGFSVKWGD